MAASFNSLPAELVKRIVDMVHAQDERYPHQFRRAARLAPPPPGLDEGELEMYYDDDTTNVAAGVWRSWHGRGVKALAMVSKGLYELASPLVHECVTAKQLDGPFFRIEVLGQPLAKRIRHVKVLETTRLPPSLTVSLASALRNLPALDTLSVHTRFFQSILPLSRQSTFEDDLSRGVLLSAFSHLRSLRVSGAETSGLALVLRCAPALRHLQLESARDFLAYDAQLADALNALKVLNSLELLHLGEGTLDAWRDKLHLPSLQRLELTAPGNAAKALAFASAIAPNLAHLRLGYFWSRMREDDQERIRFPSLRTLDVQGDRPNLDVLTYLDAPSLHILRVELEWSDFESDFAIKASHFQSEHLLHAPQVLALNVHTARAVPVSADLAAVLAERNIHLSVHRAHSDEIFAASGVDPANAPDEVNLVQADAVEETLRWALDRLAFLRATGDAVAMDELAEASLRLRHRQMMEQA
ncbi:hypothetical protein JCM10450v2_005094 [Rhodotorula kratochvilovae]